MENRKGGWKSLEVNDGLCLVYIGSLHVAFFLQAYVGRCPLSRLTVFSEAWLKIASPAGGGIRRRGGRCHERRRSVPAATTRRKRRAPRFWGPFLQIWRGCGANARWKARSRFVRRWRTDIGKWRRRLCDEAAQEGDSFGRNVRRGEMERSSRPAGPARNGAGRGVAHEISNPLVIKAVAVYFKTRLPATRDEERAYDCETDRSKR